MKTLPTPHPPRLGGFHPCTGEAQTPGHSPLCYGNLDTFFTQHCRRRPHSTAHPHLGPERVSLPYFTQDHVVGALFPPPALYPDLGLTSSVTGVSGPDSCRPGGGGGGGSSCHPTRSLGACPLCLAPVGRQS